MLTSMSSMDIDFIKPDQPQCGWLSPEGDLFPCMPWGHAMASWEIVRAMRMSGVSINFLVIEAHDFLWKLGWVKIERWSKSDMRRFGGQFRFTNPHHATMTPEQDAVEAAWMQLDAIDVGAVNP